MRGEDIPVGQTAIIADTDDITTKATRLNQNTFRIVYEHPKTERPVLTLTTDKQSGTTNLDQLDTSFWTLEVDDEEKPITNIEEYVNSLDLSETQVEIEERKIILHTKGE